MLSAYERQLILFYLSNTASRFHHAFPGKKEALAEWVAENRDLLAFEDENEEPDEHQAGGHHEKEISARGMEVPEGDPKKRARSSLRR